ncbi:MAG: arylesterase [Blastocatellales bacterium]|nr:arylesterase [Blastocatellales bacterium]
MPASRCNYKQTIRLVALFLLFSAISGCRSDAPIESAAAPAPVASHDNPESSQPDLTDAPVIVAFGDSLTAGYGLPESQSYPARLQRLLLERGYRYRVINAGVSGDTSAGGVRRIDWALTGDVRILILELGGNDALRGQPPAELKKNLAAIIEKARQQNVRVIIAGMEAPPNLGPDYTREFRSVFRDLSREYNAPLIPFFLDRVGGVEQLNQPDGIHPNEKGTEIVVENVFRVLEPLLKE